MGFWSIVVPEATTNLSLNTSFETNITGWTTGGANTIAQSSEQSRFGAYSLKCTYQDNTNLATNANLTLTAVAHTLSGYAYVPTAYDGAQPELRVEGYAGATGTDRIALDLTLRDQWQRVSCTFTPDAGDLIGNIVLREAGVAGTPGVFIYIDALQLEALGYVTTYCDGDQLGCEWNGTAHGSTSTRSALSRAGGRVYDLTDDFSFLVTGVLDSGVAPLTQHLDEYAIIEGGEIPSYKVHPRILTLQGFMFSRAGHSALHALIQSLIDILKPDAVPENQPVLLRYTEATVTKEIAVRYEAGIAGNYRARRCAQQLFQLRFIAADPFWYEIGESSDLLDTNDTATLRYMAGRLRSTGQWDDLGLTNNPTANGTIRAILVASDKSVYFGGNFDGLNNDTPAGSDYVIRFDPSDESFNLLVGASDVNGQVTVIAEGPDGIIYLGGSFTAVNGVGTADYIVSYDPVADTWASLGDPDNGAAAIVSVWALAFDSEGNLYVGGDFVNWANVAAADYFAVWDGTAWAATGTGGTGAVYAIAIDEDDNIYIGGAFLAWNADADADSLAWWNGTTWAAVNDTALNNSALALLYDRPSGLLYIGGYFTDPAGIATADYLVTWNGQTFAAVGGGIASTLANPGINALDITPDGSLYIAGYRLETAEGITLPDSLARWNGSVWTHVDVNISGTPFIYAIAHGEVDPVVPDNFDLWLGFSTTGAGYFSGDATVTNAGTNEVRPIIAVERDGGTSASLVQIRNETTGKELLFDYALLDGETLTIDPWTGTVDSSFYGKRDEALLAGSNEGEFNLRSGTNNITAFVDVAGAPTITAYMLWRDKYWSTD